MNHKRTAPCRFYCQPYYYWYVCIMSPYTFLMSWYQNDSSVIIITPNISCDSYAVLRFAVKSFNKRYIVFKNVLLCKISRSCVEWWHSLHIDDRQVDIKPWDGKVTHGMIFTLIFVQLCQVVFMTLWHIWIRRKKMDIFLQLTNRVLKKERYSFNNGKHGNIWCIHMELNDRHFYILTCFNAIYFHQVISERIWT
jgi:hypothetical protein